MLKIIKKTLKIGNFQLFFNFFLHFYGRRELSKNLSLWWKVSFPNGLASREENVTCKKTTFGPLKCCVIANGARDPWKKNDFRDSLKNKFRDALKWNLDTAIALVRILDQPPYKNIGCSLDLEHNDNAKFTKNYSSISKWGRQKIFICEIFSWL